MTCAPSRHHHGRSGRDRPGDHRQGLRRGCRTGSSRAICALAGHRQQRRARAGARRSSRPTSPSPRSTRPTMPTGRRSVPCRPVRRASRSCRACSRPMAAASPISPIERGVRLAQAGRIGAIVTAPLNKEALNKAGYHYPGHTEMLAELTGVRGSVMMLAHGNMRVSHVTTHVALEDVPKRLTPERLRRVIDLTHEALLRLGMPRAPHRRRRAQPACGRGRPVRPAGHRRLRRRPSPKRSPTGSTWSGRCPATRSSSSCAPASTTR